ncbi:MAG: tetratricopeptide repeat protein, partial [Magnetococcales bacterium]|nr:tetratricopeptide repeat protein [Magnetococcales bacterium]
EGRWDKALTVLKRMEKLTGTPDPRREAHLLVRLGQDAISRGKSQKEASEEDESEITDYLRRAIKVFPGCVEAYRLLGEHYMTAGKPKSAIKILTDLMKARPSHFFLLVDALQRAHTLQNDEKGFEKCMNQAVAMPVSSSKLLLRWAQHLAQQGRVEEAQAVLVTGITRHPGNPDLNRHYAELLVREGRCEDAIVSVQHCLDHIIAKQHQFQCSRCGFRSLDIFWKCPQCHHWDTMEPL